MRKGKCCLLLFLFGSVFGVPLEVLVEKQNSTRPIPLLVIRCVDYLVKSGSFCLSISLCEFAPLGLMNDGPFVEK
jgi:hypothetical protein